MPDITGNPKVPRRLAAILAADIAGYSTLMGADEARTVRDLKGHQAVILPMIGEHGGRIIDTAGDGILAEFGSVVNAVECALAIQKIMHERNASVEGFRRMQFRIGVNLGDVIHDDARVYGDGVNVAARLETIAEPSGICVSGKVYEEIRGRVKIGFEDIGEQTLKNISFPVRTYRLRTSEVSREPAKSKAKYLLHRLPLNVLMLAGFALTLVTGALASWWALSSSRVLQSPPSKPPLAAYRAAAVFDGAWSVNRTSRNCERGNSAFQIEVKNGVINVDAQRGIAQQGKGTLTDAGLIQFSHSAESGQRTLYSGEVRGRSGSGTFYESASCSGSFTAAQQLHASKFDGTWQATSTGGAKCPVKSNTWHIHIENGAITPSSPELGKIDDNGAFTFTTRAIVDPSVVIRWTGKFTETSGAGEYIGSAGCVGTIALKRL